MIWKSYILQLNSVKCWESLKKNWYCYWFKYLDNFTLCEVILQTAKLLKIPSFFGKNFKGQDFFMKPSVVSALRSKTTNKPWNTTLSTEWSNKYDLLAQIFSNMP